MSEPINIVNLIEGSSTTVLTNASQTRLISKIQSTFVGAEQQLFIASFYCYLNYSPCDFIVSIDDIWKWIGFSNKGNSKRLLETHFTRDTDYTITLLRTEKSTKERILLTIGTFKKLCLKSGTNRADQIHDYFIKLEQILQEVLREESNEIKEMFAQTKMQLESALTDKDKLREKTILEQFPPNIQCVYYGTIDNLSNDNEKLIKFGNSNNLRNRVVCHRDTYSNFRLISAFRVENKLQIENAMKENEIISIRQRTITIKYKKYVELLNVEGLTFVEINKLIKSIISKIEFSPENYTRLLEDNRLLKETLNLHHTKNSSDELTLLISENNKLKIENTKLMKKYNALKGTLPTINVETDIHVSNIEIDTYGTNIAPIIKNFTKNKDGSYNINNETYSKIMGNRDDVWKGIAHKTSGGLIKSDLIISITGKILSKKKSIYETQNNRFIEVNKRKAIPKTELGVKTTQTINDHIIIRY